MNIVENINTRTPLAQAILTALMARNEQAGIIQASFIGLVEEIAKAIQPKIAVLKNDTLQQVFAANLRGEDSKRIASWLAGFTPIKVMFSQETGRFEKITWSAARVKNCKIDGASLFDVAGMKAVLWTEFDPTAGRAKATPEVEKGLAALFKVFARGVDGEVFRAEDARKIMESAIREFDERLETARSVSTHDEWVETFKAEQLAARRREDSRKNVVQIKAA